MLASWALVISQAAVTPTPVATQPAATPTPQPAAAPMPRPAAAPMPPPAAAPMPRPAAAPTPQQVTAPPPSAAPPYPQQPPHAGQPYAPPPPYAGQAPYAPQPPYGPPDLETLDRHYGPYYTAPKGKALTVSGGITLAVGAPLLFGALVCLFTGAAMSDSGDDESARVLLYTAAGLGISGVLGVGGGSAMLVIGKARKRKYHQWLLQQSGSAPVQIGWRPGLLLGPQRAGLSWTLRF